jgi:hypothetical protein
MQPSEGSLNENEDLNGSDEPTADALSRALTLLVVLAAATGVFIGGSIAIALMWSGRHKVAYIVGGLSYFVGCIVIAAIFYGRSRNRGETTERSIRSAALGLVILHVVLSPLGVLILSL